MVRALAMGADAVMLGRAFVYALATGGEAGVLNLLNLIDKEMRVAMTLTGAARVSDLDESFLERGSVAPIMERQGALS